MPECGNDTIKSSLMHYGTASKLINSYGNYLPSDAVSYPKRLESGLTLLQQRYVPCESMPIHKEL